MTKYPFVVTVYRRPSPNKPVIQQHSFEDIGIAHLKMGEFATDRSVIRVSLAVVLKEITYHSRQASAGTIHQPLTHASKTS